MKESAARRGNDGEFLMGMLLDSLEFKLHGCGVTPLTYPYSEPWHAHPCGCVSQVKFAGRVSTVKGQAPMEQMPGDAVISPPNEIHTVCFHDSPGGKSLARWSLFDFRVMQFADVLAFFELPKVVSGDAAERFGDFNEAMTTLRRAEDVSKLEAAVRIKKIGFAMLEAMFELVPLKKTSVDVWDAFAKVGPALDFIESHFADRVTVKELARKAGMSATRFHAAFKRAAGASPMEYLIGHRMKNAQRLLSSTALSVREVAERCGYDDQFFFSRIFKARAGMPPTDYRGLAARMYPRMTCSTLRHEPLAVLARGGAETLPEGAGEVVDVVETG